MHYDAELFISHPFGSSLVERIELSFVLMLQSCFIKLDEGKGGEGVDVAVVVVVVVGDESMG